jgi:hypothetical protein
MEGTIGAGPLEVNVAQGIAHGPPGSRTALPNLRIVRGCDGTPEAPAPVDGRRLAQALLDLG